MFHHSPLKTVWIISGIFPGLSQKLCKLVQWHLTTQKGLLETICAVFGGTVIKCEDRDSWGPPHGASANVAKQLLYCNSPAAVAHTKSLRECALRIPCFLKTGLCSGRSLPRFGKTSMAFMQGGATWKAGTSSGRIVLQPVSNRHFGKLYR